MTCSAVRLVSVAAMLALLPSVAFAQDTPRSAAVENRLEAAAEAFEARMDGFGERAEVVAGDPSLSQEQRGDRMNALWAEYQPDVTAFTAIATQHAAAIAQAALADVDVDAVVADALKAVDMTKAMTAAGGIAANSAWTNPDPEQLVTYGLIADYAMAQASDVMAQAHDEGAPETAAVPLPPQAPDRPEASQASEI